MPNQSPALPLSSFTADAVLTDPVLFDHASAAGSYRNGDKSYANSNQDSAFSRQKSLPVRGRAQGGQDGTLTVEENPIDWTFRPADLQGVNEAFAIYVNGDSMVPKYKNGDLVYIHPTEKLAKDRFVLIETKEHRGFIKQFIRWKDDTLVLQQFNPLKEIRLPRSEILRVMLAIGSLDC